MSYAKPKTIAPKPMTEEQAKAQAIQEIIQKREALAQGIFVNAFQAVKLTEANVEEMAEKSVKAAEALLQALYKGEE